MWWEAVIEARKWARLSGLVQTAGETAARSGPPRGLVYHLVVLILIALAPVGLIGGVVVADRTLQSQQRFRERLIERAAATSHALDRDIAIIGSALAATAAAPGVRHWPAGPIWAPGAGSGIYVHVPTEADPPPAVRQVFREARPAVGRSVPGETGDRSGPGGLTIYQPVIDAGTVVAVIGMTLTRAEIDHLLAEDSAGLAGPVAMVDADGEVVAGARDTGAMPSGRAPGWLFAPPRGGHVDPMRYGSWPDRLAPGGLAKVCAVNQPSALASWRLVVCEDREHYDGYWRETLGSSTMILLASVAVGIVSAIVLAQRLALPMRVLSDYARAVSRGKTRPGELPRSTVVEFEVLRLRLAEAEAVLRRRAVAERVARMDARNSERMLSSVLDAMGEAIHVKDFDGRYVMTNAAARYYLGVSETAGFAVGRRVADLFEPATAQSMTALDRDALATDTTQALEIVHYIAGIPRRLAVTKRAWRDYNGQIAGVVTVARDVTEEAEAESRLRMLQADLLRTSRLSSMWGDGDRAGARGEPAAGGCQQLPGRRAENVGPDGPR